MPVVHRTRMSPRRGGSGVELDVLGADQYRAFAERLQTAPPELRREARQALLRAARPLGRDVRKEIPPVMPRGYEAVLNAALRIRTSMKSGLWAGVEIEGRAPGTKGHAREIERMEHGELRHPVFGRFRRLKDGTFRRNPWALQPLRPGFWTRPMREGLPTIRRELLRAVIKINRKIVGS